MLHYPCEWEVVRQAPCTGEPYCVVLMVPSARVKNDP